MRAARVTQAIDGTLDDRGKPLTVQPPLFAASPLTLLCSSLLSLRSRSPRYNNNRSNHNQNHNAGPSSAPQTRVMGSFKPVSSAPANADPLVTQLSALISKLHSPVAATDSFKIVPIAELDIAANIEKLTAVIVNGAQGRFLKPSSDDPADDSDDDSDAEADAKDEPKPPSKTHDPDWLAERALEKGRGDATSVASEGFIHFDEDAPKRPPTSTLIINTFKTNLYYTTATDLAGLLPPLLMNSLLSLPLATATYTSLLLSLISSASTPHHKTLAPRLNTLLHAALSHAIDTLIAPTATPTHFDAAEHYTTAYGTAVAGVRVVTMLQYAGALEGRVFEQLVGLIDKFNGESGDDNSSRRDVLLNVLMHGVITGIHLGMEVGDVVEDIERIVKGRKGVFNTGRKSVMLEIDEGESDEDEEEEEDDEFQVRRRGRRELVVIARCRFRALQNSLINFRYPVTQSARAREPSFLGNFPPIDAPPQNSAPIANRLQCQEVTASTFSRFSTFRPFPCASLTLVSLLLVAVFRQSHEPVQDHSRLQGGRQCAAGDCQVVGGQGVAGSVQGGAAGENARATSNARASHLVIVRRSPCVGD